MTPLNQGASSGELLALAERLEAAAGPDRELDEAIAMVMGWSREWVDHGFRKTTEWKRPEGASLPIGTLAEPPFFTASIDAARSLVPEEWAWSAGIDTPIPGFSPASANAWPQAQPFPVELDIFTDGATPALALVSAALKARAAQGGDR